MTTQTDSQPIYLARLEIENYMRVRAEAVEPEGAHVVITGPNGSGKTSVVQALFEGLRGSSSKETPEPIRQGAERARVKIELDNELVIERIWTETGCRLVVTAADGSAIRRPQQLLDSLLGRYSLDPIAFLERRPQDQVDDVLAVCGVEPPLAKVQYITGETIASKPGESADAYLMRLSADDSGVYYVRRREAGRLTDQKRKALEEQRQIVASLGGPLAPQEQEQSASELLGQIEHLQQKAEEKRAVEAKAAQALIEEEGARQKLETLRGSHQALVQRGKALRAQIRELEQQRDQAEREAQTLADRMARGNSVIAEMVKEREAAQDAAARLPDPAPKITELRRQVAGMEQANAQRARRQHAGGELERLAGEVGAAQGEHKRLDQILERLRDVRAHLLDGIDLGVPGLAVGDGELRLNGVSFRQASQAEQIRLACAIAMRQGPRLRLLRVDEGERLDARSRELLFGLANQHGWQIVFTSVADTEGLKVEIVEG